MSQGFEDSMLRRLYVDNYKCLVNFELPLQELSLLLGRNGVGKTSVLDVVFALRRLLSGSVKVTSPDAFPTRTLTRWQSREQQTFEIEVHVDTDTFRYRLEVEHERATRQGRICREELTSNGQPLFRCQMGNVQLYRDDHSEGPRYKVDWSESALARVAAGDDNRRLTRFRDFVNRIVVCGLYPASFRAESSAEDALLQRDARNFADWYRHVLLERPDLIPAFTGTLGEVLEGFQSIRLERVGQETRALMVTFHEGGQDYELRFDEISDGQRALIALYGLVHLAHGQGYTFFLDEPDNYVALPEIQPWLMKLSDACGKSLPQAVLCSHHPELIDYLGANAGIVLSREAPGVVTAKTFDPDRLQGSLKLSEEVARGWAG